jgi:SAM-dependent methyltransferase
MYGIRLQSRLTGKKPNFAKKLTTNKQLVRVQGEALYYDNEVARMMKIAIQEGLSPTHVYLYRGLWGRFKMFQDWQMKALKEIGLKPEHHFLDVGCGILRLGIPLIQYLDTDRYCGMDPIEEYIKVAKRYMSELVQTDKAFHLITDWNFGFKKFERQFDYAMAQSVFTHLSYSQIEDCFIALKKVMKPGGKFLFTVLLNKQKEQDFLYIGNQPITKSSHSGIGFYTRLAKKYDFKISHQSKAAHPSQDVILATF